MANTGFSTNVEAFTEEGAVARAISQLEAVHEGQFHETPLYVERLWGNEWEVVLRPRISDRPGRKTYTGSWDTMRGGPFVMPEPTNPVEAEVFGWFTREAVR